MATGTLQGRVARKTNLENVRRNIFVAADAEVSQVRDAQNEGDFASPVLAQQEISRLLREWPRVQPH